MTKIFILLMSVLYLFVISEMRADILDDVRKNYDKMASNEELCKSAIANLKGTKNNSSTHLGYLGGLQTIWANHVFSIMSKLNTFKEGKKNIEEAIKKEPDNVELRFIRLSVQKNAPSFLGYKSNITEDIQFIKNNRSQIKSPVLNRHIESLLKE
ncbi:hypothetical protein SAMN05660477_00494 [Soonwooa buanensis]|uniref:Uncharacterized protein n=1 Tax=Soonwooa buanensis TaxID=619805 RepID=A0A1T5D023_9FLAO|nr:hypothetical protein [Soonwooa buanensis]SKB65072.1 hypothetical protein SAMN05660477_00494 [Soonwooa buanensis]